jgi:membrane protein DedA with SNARE-associated domain
METISYISALLGRFPYAGIVVSLILGSVGFPLPEDAILLCSGLLIARGVLSPAPALATVFAGVLLSDLSMYTLGKRFGRRIVTHRWFGRIIRGDRLAAIEVRFNIHGTWVILLCRQIFGMRSQVLLIAGVMRMRFARFLITDAFAVLLTMAIMVTAGYTGGRAIDGITELKGVIVAALFVITLAGCVLFGLAQARKRRHDAMET